MREIGINICKLNGLDDGAYIDAIASLGFNCIFSGVYDLPRQTAIADRLARNGMYYETLHAPFGHINDMWLEGEGGDAMLNELRDCIDRCALVSAPIAVVHMSSGNNAPPITDIGRGRFTDLFEYAAKKNVRIAVENQRKLANIAWAMESFSVSDGVGFCWDCGHESCFTPGREYMPLFGDRLICTHIHDNYGVYNQDDHMLPFDGKIDFARFAEHIRKSGYTGSFMLEIIPEKSGRYADITPLEFLEKAADSVKRLVEMTDVNV